VRPDNAVVVDTDRDRLGITEPGGGRVAAGAGIVVVEPGNGVKPEQAPDLGQLRIDAPAEPLLE
jgi:hypothetical protein